MHNNNILTSEGVAQLNKAIDNILTSFMNLISIAEELIPEELAKKGLRICLIKLCQEFEAEKHITINLIDKWEEAPLSKNTELTIYKIFNSLITFIISQKGVSQISINIVHTKASFSFSAMFTNKKFTLSGITSSEIKTISQIKSMIESLNGNFVFSQQQENVTEISVEVKT